jgi:large subunit ribosomal protein L18
MENKTKIKHIKMKRRSHRTRAKIKGTSDRPRLTVKRSLKHIYAQIINDATGKTLAAVSDADIKEKKKPVELAKEVGLLLGSKAEKVGVKEVVFDRGSYKYHGRVASLADGAREAGLKF